MAKQIASQMTAWAKPIQTVELADTGDPTLVLRRIYQKYAKKAIELYQKVSGDNAIRIRAAAEYYEQASIDIQRLIDQGGTLAGNSVETPVETPVETCTGNGTAEATEPPEVVDGEQK